MILFVATKDSERFCQIIGAWTSRCISFDVSSRFPSIWHSFFIYTEDHTRVHNKNKEKPRNTQTVNDATNVLST